jgi:murein DD-endopeptidase MepM/ murein hydrolase activator NlpD
MDGMRNKRLAQIVLGSFFLSTFLLFTSCSHKRVGTQRRPPRQEKKVVRKASINGIADPSKIQTGQRIFIPGARKVLKVEIVIDDVAAEQVERERERPETVYEKVDFIWPVEGKCTNPFEDNERRRHQGIDISCSSGTPIKASNAGTVIYAGNTIKGYGNMVILRHSEEFVTVYAHNQVNLVKERDRIEKGQIIGKVGQTGRATGPHLHFEIRRNNKPVDPVPYLK